MFYKVFAALLVALTWQSAFAASSTFQTEVDGRTVTCGQSGSSWIPGKLTRGKFKSFADEIRTLQASLKKAAAAKKAKIKLKIKKAKGQRSADAPTCREGPPDGFTPDPTETPTPTPTAAPSTGNFDSSGNVTAQGKAAFGIPSSLSANISTGKAIHQQNSCVSCHGEKTGASFSKNKSALGQSSMTYLADVLSDGDLANITAYLNRFKMN